MTKLKPVTGSSKEELFKGLLASIEERFVSSYANQGSHLFYGYDGCYTDEDVEKSRQEFIRDGGDPEALSIIIKFVSVPNPPPWAKVANEAKQQSPDNTGFDDFLD